MTSERCNASLTFSVRGHPAPLVTSEDPRIVLSSRKGITLSSDPRMTTDAEDDRKIALKIQTFGITSSYMNRLEYYKEYVNIKNYR